ncbi:hypothetical protein [Streptomyces sp. NPDC003077]
MTIALSPAPVVGAVFLDVFSTFAKEGGRVGGGTLGTGRGGVGRCACR